MDLEMNFNSKHILTKSQKKSKKHLHLIIQKMTYNTESKGLGDRTEIPHNGYGKDHTQKTLNPLVRETVNNIGSGAIQKITETDDAE